MSQASKGQLPNGNNGPDGRLHSLNLVKQEILKSNLNRVGTENEPDAYTNPELTGGVLQQNGTFLGMVGGSPKMLECFSMLEKIMPTEGRVLILGESGTGKELIARSLHNYVPRKDKAYIVVDCGTLPVSLVESELFGYVRGAFTGANRDKKGLFEEADKGTLFLDEIVSLSTEMQGKLLRVIQEGEIRPLGSTHTKKIDVRIIAACSLNLRAEVAAGRFREDLFYRLNVVSLTAPPLRDRKEDIVALAEYFLNRMNARHHKTIQGFAPDTLTYLQNYDWPGNVRELENAVERTVILADKDLEIIPPDLLPPEVLSPGFHPFVSREQNLLAESVESQKDGFEKAILLGVLVKHGWNQSAAARELDITEGAIRYKIRKYSITKAY